MASFFSGIGGFEEASRGLGYEVVQLCEIDPFAQSTLKSLHPGVPIHHDITKFNGFPLRGRIDIIVGGFPCQSASVANVNGRGINDDAKTGLWRELLRVVTEAEPRFCLFENVSNLLNRGYDRIAQDLDEAGYEVESYLLGADDIGATHRRKRIWIVAYNRRLCRWNLPEIERRLDPSSELWSGDYYEASRSGGDMGAGEHGSSELADLINDGEVDRQWGGESQLPETLNRNAAMGAECERGDVSGSDFKQVYPFPFPPAPEDFDRWESVARTHPHLLPCVERKLLPVADGLSPESLRQRRSAFRAESRKRNAMIKALGNALVPACARPILAGIKELFDMMED